MLTNLNLNLKEKKGKTGKRLYPHERSGGGGWPKDLKK